MSWKSKFLSYVGHLMLIKSILFNIQIYWASLFLLPSKVINEIKSILRAFFWDEIGLTKRKARMVWKDMCKPRNWGLNILSHKELNKAALIKHIWDICQPTSNFLWIDWIMNNKIKNKRFWETKVNNSSIWNWKRILKLREFVRKRIKVEIDDGKATFLWKDNWYSLGPLIEKFGEKNCLWYQFTCGLQSEDDC